MIVEAVDLGCKKSLLGSINLIKKSVTIEKNKQPVQKIYAFPVIKSIFRKYTFPGIIKDRKKLEKAVETNLRVDLPIPFENCEYDFVHRDKDGKTEIFCVIVPKEEIKEIKESIDSEIFAILRLCKSQNVRNGKIIHYGDNYVYRLKFDNYFPEEIRVLDNEELNDKDVLFSGCIPNFISQEKILKNPLGDPSLNVAYGLLLKFLDNFGIDFSHKSSEESVKYLTKGILYLILIFAVVNLSLLFEIYLKEKELKKVLSAEKELFIKYFGLSQVYDPLEQAKGLLFTAKISQKNEDITSILNYMGKAKMLSKIKNIYKINISGNSFLIEGKANSIQDIENFKKILSQKYKVSIDETVSAPEGYVRFVIKGEV